MSMYERKDLLPSVARGSVDNLAAAATASHLEVDTSFAAATTEEVQCRSWDSTTSTIGLHPGSDPEPVAGSRDPSSHGNSRVHHIAGNSNRNNQNACDTCLGETTRMDTANQPISEIEIWSSGDDACRYNVSSSCLSRSTTSHRLQRQ